MHHSESTGNYGGPYGPPYLRSSFSVQRCTRKCFH